ncbi:hypothetical protein KOI35_43105 [Actinoplanes bogorensis]|uniref:Uncharacterized protein n=1 Tax=Paractinoplanes bogorensis TaxID=1610840 RepID=A0ABS5Z3Q3_9ACTN|nr:hypothetical protein [Actinoplanes bogorensis]MBU2670313.1 hypothetical protein [Actinoplanes bogorensis]
MAPDSAFFQELKTLRSREGVQRGNLHDYLGPRIRTLCGLLKRENDAKTRTVVQAWLTELAGTLTKDHGQAVLVSFAVGREFGLQTLGARIGELARLQRVSTRTARRLADQALNALAAAAGEDDRAIDVDTAGSGWRVSSLCSLYRLDTPTPELYEIRTIVATRELREVVIRISFPEPPPGVGEPVVNALFGAGVRKNERLERSRLLTLDLPRPLERDEKHEFWLHVTLPEDQPTSPHYAIVPLAPCDYGTVRVRFAADRMPDEVWLLDEVPYMEMDARSPERPAVTPTAHGEVFREFHGLREGHAYGLAWSFCPSESGMESHR